MTRMILTFFLLLSTVALGACGKKGELEPPSGYQEPDYERAPELEPNPMDEEEKTDDK